MTCHECEFLVADGELSATAAHLASCPGCRAFADEIAANALALRAMRDDPVVLRPRGVRRWWWAAAAVALGVGLSRLVPEQDTMPTAPLLAPISAPAIAAELPPAPRAVPRRRMAAPSPGPAGQLLVRLESRDPEVVLYWVLDSANADSAKEVTQ